MTRFSSIVTCLDNHSARRDTKIARKRKIQDV